MATNHTENYNLNLWEPTDKFVREEFNENSEKIDEALGTLFAGLNKKAGVPEKIYTYTNKIGGVTQIDFYSSSRVDLDWNEWDYVAAFMDYESTSSSATDKIELVTMDDLKLLLEIKAGPFILVMLPRHDATRTISGFVIGESVKFFSSELTYSALTMINLALSGNEHPQMKNIRLTLLGGR